MGGKATGTKKEKLVRKLGDKVVTPTLYFGKHAGHGKYMTGSVDGNMVCDSSGKPLPLNEVGEIVRVV